MTPRVIRGACLAALSLLWASATSAFECRDLAFEGIPFTACEVDAQAEPLSLFLDDAPIGFSCGIAALTESEHQVERSLSNADRALYQAKSRGRNRTEIAGRYPQPHADLMHRTQRCR